MSDHFTIRAPESAALADHCLKWHDKDEPAGLTGVRRWSHATVRRHAETIARQFKREFRYDFMQYLANEDLGKDAVFLWHENGDVVINRDDQIIRRERAVGACVFRWRKREGKESYYALAWVWIHPYRRNRGLLTKAWPYFQEKFGDFHIERPLSPAMQHFIDKVTG